MSHSIAEQKENLYAEAERIQNLAAEREQKHWQANHTDQCQAQATKPEHTAFGLVGQPDLRERVHHARRRAESETRRAMALAELEHLLDKHPDVARILELVEQTRMK